MNGLHLWLHSQRECNYYNCVWLCVDSTLLSLSIWQNNRSFSPLVNKISSISKIRTCGHLDHREVSTFRSDASGNLDLDQILWHTWILNNAVLRRILWSLHLTFETCVHFRGENLKGLIVNDIQFWGILYTVYILYILGYIEIDARFWWQVRDVADKFGHSCYMDIVTNTQSWFRNITLPLTHSLTWRSCFELQVWTIGRFYTVIQVSNVEFNSFGRYFL